MWLVPPDPPALLPLLTGLGDVREFRRLEEAGGGPAKLPDLECDFLVDEGVAIGVVVALECTLEAPLGTHAPGPWGCWGWLARVE